MSSGKYCGKCKQWKNWEDFSKDKKNKDMKYTYYKDCKREKARKWRENNPEKARENNRKWYENNPEKVRENNRKWYENNPEKAKEKARKWYENNPERARETARKWRENNPERARENKRKQRENTPEKARERDREKNRKRMYSNLEYNSQSVLRQRIGLYEEIRKSVNNNVECKCTYCGDWFEPIYRELHGRLQSIDGTIQGESRLYCSQQCKDNCPIYKQILYPKGYEPITSREVQPELRQMVFERDNYTCQKCSKHRDELDCGIQCHHIYPLNEDPIQSADMDACITYCEDCHKEIHMNVPGCSYGELRCA